MTRSRWVVWVASGFGAGFSPWAPGTVGSVAALALWWPLLGGAAYPWVLLAVTIVGIPLCGSAARILGRADPPAVVWDEIIGMGLTLWAIPDRVIWVVVGFGLFRLFDITKPPPLRRLERLPGGSGIVADDVGAGIYAYIVLWGLIWAIRTIWH